MLTEEHFDMLTRFRVRAMGDKLREMVEDDSYDSYTFEERMEMLIEAEATARRDRKVAKLVVPSRFLRTFRQPPGPPRAVTRPAASHPGSGGNPTRSPRRT